ncbi:MAG: hypothetical protein HYU66_15120 [Armatimonadetes bacterium]|nr:hypothetical protein [Armatimonadota bacterium]
MGRTCAVFVLAVVFAAAAAEPVVFTDQLATAGKSNWTGIPAQPEARDGALVIRGAGGGARITSRDKFRYGRYTVRFQVSGIAPGNYVYLGFFTRDPWGHNLCSVILDGGRFRLQLRRLGGKVAEPFETPAVTPGDWHVLTLDWQPAGVEMLWDAQSCGQFESAESIPDTFVTSFIDVVQTGVPPLEVLVDSVRIEGGEVRRADRSGLTGPRPPLRTPPDSTRLARPTPTPPVLRTSRAGAVLENAYYRAELDWSRGLRLTALTHKAAGLPSLVAGAWSDLFVLAADGQVVRSSDFLVTGAKVTRSAGRASLRLEAAAPNAPWRIALSLSSDSAPQIRLGLEVTSGSGKEQTAAVCWPSLSGLQLGGDPGDNYYLFPFKGGWCNNRPMALAAVYGQSTGFAQLFALFSPRRGSVLYTYLRDDTGRIKTIAMRKQDQPDTEVSSYLPVGPETRLEEGVLTQTPGTQVAMRHLPTHFAPGQRRVLPEAVLAVEPGDWREAMRSYSGWAHTWLKDPRVPDWYKAVFQTVAVHDEVGNKGFDHGFLGDDQWALAEQAQPGDGLLEVPYWWNHPHSDGVGPPRPGKRGWYKHTVGQYDYWDELGGLTRLRQEIAGVHAKGVRANLYTCPYFAWAFSDVRKAHPEWLLVNSDGAPSRDWSAEVGGVSIRYDDMCYAQAGWQDYMAAVAGRLIRDTGADGIYMDTMNQHKFCYAPGHRHPDSPSLAAEAMLRKIRAAVKAANPRAVMTAEDLCSERLGQFVDGSLIKTFESSQPDYTDYDLYDLHFVRFYFPEIKFVEWGSTFADGARRAFFNGVGYMRGDLGPAKDPFTGELLTTEAQQRYLAATSRIMSENADAFATLSPEPLVPTLVPRVYANRFPGRGQTIWTLYNRSGESLDCDVIEVKHAPGARYMDLLSGSELAAVVRGGKATLRLRLGNGEVRALAQRLGGRR